MEYYDESYDYIITKPELNEDLLMHFGVKGMRWGHRKQRPVSGIRRAGRAGVQSPKKAASQIRTAVKRKNSKSGQIDKAARQERTKKVLKGAAIAAGVAVGAMAVHTFVTSPYAKGNRMYVAGKTKQAVYNAGRKFADSVVRRRQARAAKAYTKSLPRIGAKKVIDTTYRDLSTGVSTYVKKNRSGLKTAAAVAGAAGTAAGTAATAYTIAKKKKKKS